MKKESSGGSEKPKPKILGANPLQDGGADASSLVGGIVEKGFSDIPQPRALGPTSAPRPTALPFPVARHRSHGPLQEIVKNDGKSGTREIRKEIHLTGLGVGHKTKGINPSKISRQITDNPNENVNDNAQSDRSTTLEKLSKWENGSSKDIQEDLKKKSTQKYHVASGFAAQKLVGGEEDKSESQIDAENRARLAKMSVYEIAAAQAEIKANFNPNLINALKRRSQTKVKWQKTYSEADRSQHAKNGSKLSESYANTTTNEPVKVVPGDTLQDKDDKAFSNISIENRSKWDCWSRRVESVREMRFSLDGNVFRGDFAHASDTGNPSSESGYSADNASERDFLRTEGDPGASGYTIKEAVALTRSVVPGQHTLALHLIAAVLDKAICSIWQSQADSAPSNLVDAQGPVDWEAIWAFALGPEPELALSLRMSLDDNHNSVVLACAKAIQSMLSCTTNDVIFDILEKTPTYAGGICTAPVFRSKTDINVGFIRGGFWKYNAKPSNIHRLGEDMEGDKAEGEHTIQDVVVLAGLDLAAGLVRMGILPRICHLLETDPAAPLEECLISILTAIARHSPTCAAAIVDSRRLVQTVVDRFASKEQLEINLCKIKSVTLSKTRSNVIPEDITNLPNRHLPWLPEFVTQTGLEIIKNGYLQDAICNDQPSENGSVVRYLCHLRTGNGRGLAISSTCCLQGLVQVVDSVDKLIRHTNLDIHRIPFLFVDLSREDKVLANGILKSCVDEVRYLLTTSVKLITNEWQQMQPVEIFGRGGSAPGVGVGWGASDGGYFSLNTMLAQQDARLLVYLLEIFEIPYTKDPLEPGLTDYLMQILNCALTACLVVGPGNSPIIDKLLKFIFQVPVLKYLDLGIRQFLSSRQGYSPFRWKYEDKEYLLFANILSTHFRNRWLSVKTKKQKCTDETNRASHKSTKKGSQSLETIHEDDTSPSSSVGEELSSSSLEWAYQRLPLPAHWFLSAISTFSIVKNASHKETYTEVPSDFLEVAKSGLFFLLGVEAISASLSSEFASPVKSVPVVWKLHAMSVVLLSGMGVLVDEKSRDVYANLQNVYGKFVDEEELSKSQGVGCLRFESEIHDNYSIFIETLVGQFAAESDGNVLFGRQVAIYLHRSVEASVRLATWNVLSNAMALELLPPLDKCLTKAEGYLEPIEDDERILDAYAKSWLSGALDKAANQSSVTFSLVLHHLSSFIFGNVTEDLLSLRQRLARSLLGDYSSKPQHEGMVVKLVCYKRPDWNLETVSERKTFLPLCEIEKRLQLLKDICGNATAVEKLELPIRRKFNESTSV